jgi:hypothetical protein
MEDSTLPSVASKNGGVVHTPLKAAQALATCKGIKKVSKKLLKKNAVPCLRK